MSKWFRVNKEFPCVVCSRSDWDTYCPELNLACCMRVQSDRPCKNGGWIHSLNGDHRYKNPPKEPPKPTINASKMIRDLLEHTKQAMVAAFAFKIGVSVEALNKLCCAWSSERQAWAFPMYDGYGNVVGIRLRADSGAKWAVPGSRQGIFMPEGRAQRTAFVCEGPTDCAAALSIGLYCIGRPSCAGGVPQVLTAFARLGIERAVIVSDNDSPGMVGATALADQLNIPSCILIPPAKDMREFVRFGGTADVINSMVNTLIWKQP